MIIETLIIIALTMAAIPCGLFFLDLLIYRPLPKTPAPGLSGNSTGAPELSVLIPARKEEANIREALACVALPTCPLSMAEAERYLPGFGKQVERLLAAHGLRDVPLILRITGCPNGCARPYLVEIGFVGKGPGRYNLYLGVGSLFIDW